MGEEMEFGSRCRRGGEVVCRDWGCGNGKEVISGEGNGLWPKVHILQCAPEKLQLGIALHTK